MCDFRVFKKKNHRTFWLLDREHQPGGQETAKQDHPLFRQILEKTKGLGPSLPVTNKTKGTGAARNRNPPRRLTANRERNRWNPLFPKFNQGVIRDGDVRNGYKHADENRDFPFGLKIRRAEWDEDAAFQRVHLDEWEGWETRNWRKGDCAVVCEGPQIAAGDVFNEGDGGLERAYFEQ